MTTTNEITPFQEKLTDLVQYPAQADQAKTEMDEQLQAWLQFAEQTDDAPLYSAVVMLLSRSSQLHDYVHKQGAAIGSLIHVSENLKEQRDTALDDLEAIEEGLDNPWVTQHPKVKPLYERIADSHNEAFWESLPYDIAAVLGGEWDFTQADRLYTALTLDLSEIDPDYLAQAVWEEHGWSLDNLLAFRREMLELVQQYLMDGA